MQANCFVRFSAPWETYPTRGDWYTDKVDDFAVIV